MILKIAYINFCKDSENDSYFTDFINYNIGKAVVVSPYNNPDILFASVMGPIELVKKFNVKLKIFYCGKNTNRYPSYNNIDILNKYFDIIVGFKYTNLEKNIIRFPLWLLYYKYYCYNENYNIITHIEEKYKENIKKDKQSFATIVARHDMYGQRTIICNIVKMYGTILGGSNFMQTDKIGPLIKDKINFIKKGLICICPENSESEGYYTEKIFHALEAGTIPLYWAVDYPEKDMINENKYLFCNISNYNNLNKQIIILLNNISYYQDGPVFKTSAKVILKNYYDILINEIKKRLV